MKSPRRLVASGRPVLPVLALLFAACHASPPAAPQLAAPVPDPSPSMDRQPNPFAPPRALDAPADPAVPSAGGPTVQLASLRATEGYTLDDAALTAIEAEVRRNAGSLQRCWDERARVPGARSGSVALHALVGADGLVVEQCITTDELEDTAMVRCVNDVIAMGRYPATGTAADVEFPFEFTLPPA